MLNLEKKNCIRFVCQLPVFYTVYSFYISEQYCDWILHTNSIFFLEMWNLNKQTKPRRKNLESVWTQFFVCFLTALLIKAILADHLARLLVPNMSHQLCTCDSDVWPLTCTYSSSSIIFFLCVPRFLIFLSYKAHYLDCKQWYFWSNKPFRIYYSCNEFLGERRNLAKKWWVHRFQWRVFFVFSRCWCRLLPTSSLAFCKNVVGTRGKSYWRARGDAAAVPLSEWHIAASRLLPKPELGQCAVVSTICKEPQAARSRVLEEQHGTGTGAEGKVFTLDRSHGDWEGAWGSSSKENEETFSWSFCKKEKLSVLQSITALREMDVSTSVIFPKIYLPPQHWSVLQRENWPLSHEWCERSAKMLKGGGENKRCEQWSQASVAVKTWSNTILDLLFCPVATVPHSRESGN